MQRKISSAMTLSTLQAILLLLVSVISILPLSARTESYDPSTHIILSGRIKESLGKTDLTNAIVILYDSDGNPVDSIKADKASRIRKGEITPLAYFSFPVERKDSTYVFDVACPGYITRTVSHRVEKVGKREQYRNIPFIFLDRAPHKLSEVTVTASKIKFYHKGDTLVYNADAFQLAEGSMLDALIAQLPGVELDQGGQIKVNGQFVESLLLNGKQFFDGNNQLMLENIAAYTVKAVEVYDGQTKIEKWLGDSIAPKHFTMDVKLKKEYNFGTLINAQGGYGTEDRYTGRLFASWFSPTARLALIGNFNNLNDTRKPGKNDTWTPEMMPSGTKRYKFTGLNYEYVNPDETVSLDGNTYFERTDNNNLTTTARTNFLSGGNTYENAFSHSRNSNLKIETRNYGNINNDRFYLSGMLLGRYIRKKNGSGNISATFDHEQTDVTRKTLEALYSDGSPEMLDAVINRSVTRSDGSSHESEIQFYPTVNYKIPQTNDRLRLQFGIKYQNRKEDRWRDYNINYGSDPNPAVKKRQYFDDTPNYTLAIDGTAGYHTNIGKGIQLGLSYSYRFMSRNKDSYMYALDRLTDIGVYGTLPAGYLDSFDPANSYSSRLMENKHDIVPDFIGSWRVFGKNPLIVRVRPELSLLHRHFDYWRDNRSYLVSKTSFLAVAKHMAAHIEYRSGLYGQSSRNSVRNSNTFSYDYTIDTKTPDMLHMIDIVSDADPLNISVGNPDLKNSYIQTHTLSWSYSPEQRYINNKLALGADYTDNALVRGYTYDTSTGVRRNRTYNVDGNNSLFADNYFSIQFGDKAQFNINSTTNGRIANYADMIGVNLEEPVKSKVRTNTVTQSLIFAWQIGRQSLRLRGSVTNRHTTSTSEDFTTLNATHFNYGITGTFSLPYGFGLDTDFTLYARRGYGVKQLDTTDAIWNMRLTYTPHGGHWVFMADGFDLLRQLSNVNYAVNASGRTVTYTNALPRYFLFSVQYRFSLQPKKRK